MPENSGVGNSWITSEKPMTMVGWRDSGPSSTVCSDPWVYRVQAEADPKLAPWDDGFERGAEVNERFSGS